MDYLSNQEHQIREMLQLIGVNSIEELFSDIPKDLLLQKPKADDGLSEYEGRSWIEKIAQKNTFSTFDSYLGAGAYEHQIPAIVQAICSKSEFLTSYTPYQAEASQGMLQAMFEFQTAICALTGMEAANASVYDGASACAEAASMALRVNSERNTILVSDSLHPHYRAVIELYLKRKKILVETIPILDDGTLDLAAFKSRLNPDVAGVIVGYPNFFGSIDELSEIATETKKNEALAIICANPLIYGLYASAGELGFDIAVGDCQPFGLPLNFGGPYAGYMAARKELVRQLPGRIVGETVDTEGKRGFVLTLQAREQHIRRDKANSNICTNQALAALAALVTILWYGKKGVTDFALANFQRASYLKEQLANCGLALLSQRPILNEFAVHFGKNVDKVQNHFRRAGIEPGLSLGRFYPQFDGYFLIAVTETKSKAQLDYFIATAKGL